MYHEEIRAGATKSIPQVEAEISYLTDALKVLEERVQHLGEKLPAVLLPEATNGCSPDSPVVELVPLASAIRSRRFTVEAIAERVLSLTNRIEL